MATLTGIGAAAPLPRDLGVGEALGETLFGLTSVLPTYVTPSSITSLVALISPNNSDLDKVCSRVCSHKL